MVENPESFLYLYPLKNTKTMDAVWYFIGDLFQGIFKVVPFFGLFFNKLLIVIGFIAFFAWLRYMAQNKEVTNWD